MRLFQNPFLDSRETMLVESREIVMRRILVGALAAAVAAGSATAFAQQTAATGVISGTAVKEAQPPYEEYRVQLRSVATGTVVGTQPLSPTGTFTIPNVPLTTPHIVELVNIASNTIVCTEGPFTLTSNQMNRVGVRIECGSSATWLLLAAAGLPAIVGDPRSSDR
jgi:hypothetical protein